VDPLDLDMLGKVLNKPTHKRRLSGAVASDNSNDQATRQQGLTSRKIRRRHRANHTSCDLEPGVGEGCPASIAAERPNQTAPHTGTLYESGVAVDHTPGIPPEIVTDLRKQPLTKVEDAGGIDPRLQPCEFPSLGLRETSFAGDERLSRAVLDHHPDHEDQVLDLWWRERKTGIPGVRQECLLDRQPERLGHVVPNDQLEVGLDVDDPPGGLVAEVVVLQAEDMRGTHGANGNRAQRRHHIPELGGMRPVDQQIEVVVAPQ
jgi:hypothetical protein